MQQVQGLPELMVALGGRRLGAAELAAVTTVRVRSALAQPAQCQVTMRLDEGRTAVPAPGESIRVEIGGRRDPLFVGEVTVVEHSYGASGAREVRLRGYDALHRLRKRQASALHRDVDLAGLATALSNGTGLHVAGGSERLGDVYQCARSDLDLLVEQCARVGAFPVVDGAVLRLVTLAGHGDPIDLELGSSLHSAELEVSLEPAFRQVAATCWDPVDGRGGLGRADADRARAAVGAEPAPGSVGGGGLLVRADEVMSDEALATALAQAEVDARRAAEVHAVLVADGDPRLQAGRRVRVAGVTASLEGTYTVTEAVHVLDGSGYETTVSTRPPAGPPARPRDRITLGVVEDVDDPQRRGRARVRLPSYPDLVTGWAAVVVPAAGDGKGAVLLPDRGDTVLVLLPAGDPGHAVVLGGLYGTRLPPDADTPGGRGGRFTVRTAGGQQVCLDAGAGSVTLTDGQGSELALGPDLVRLSAATDLLIEAPGRSIRIRAAGVDFEEAP